ncbi:hypothetical protein LDENG_00291920, partial [Lucifuga dentata]
VWTEGHVHPHDVRIRPESGAAAAGIVGSSEAASGAPLRTLRRRHLHQQLQEGPGPNLCQEVPADDHGEAFGSAE